MENKLCWEIFLEDELIETIYYSDDLERWEVRDRLILLGYDECIVVKLKENR